MKLTLYCLILFGAVAFGQSSDDSRPATSNVMGVQYPRIPSDFGYGKQSSGIEVSEAGVDFHQPKNVSPGEVRPRVAPIALFILQFLWFLFAWSLITYFVLWPWSATLSPDARLSVWIAPEMFRVLGVGLLVPNLSPGMPAEFATTTAAADSLTAALAASAFLGLRQGWGAARGLAWACTLVGSLDILIAFPHAASTGAISHLATQWYVPVFAGPPLVICHVVCFILLASR